MPILNNGKGLMLEVFKTKVNKVAIGTGSPGTYFSETVIPWQNVGAGSLGAGTLQMSANYADIVCLRYNGSNTTLTHLRFRDASNNVVYSKVSGGVGNDTIHRGVYAIVDIPVTITSV